MLDINKYEKWAKLAFYIAILATVAFIFVNSMLPKEVSSSQSGAVGEIIEEILPDDTPIEDFVLENLRKIAHFSEYGMLGIEVALYILLFERRRWYVCVPVSILTPFLVGFIDESIQVLSDRGPSITDVWIDIGGFFTFNMLAYIVGAAVLLIIRAILKIKSNQTSEENT